jgi:hypothetical protein
LAATQRGLAFQPSTTLLTHLARLEHGRGEGMSEVMRREVAPMRRRLFDLFGLRDEIAEPVFLFRLFVAEPAAEPALRRPVAEVLRGGG